MINTKEEARERLTFYNWQEANEDRLEDIIVEAANSAVDIYTSDRWDWLKETEDAKEYLERAIEEYGWDGVNKNIVDAIGMGQYLKAEGLFREALEELQEE